MEHTTLRSLRVSGSCRIPAGQYDEVRGSGSIRIEGNVTANSFEASGSVRGQGSLETRRFRVSGSTVMQGPVELSEGRASGSVRIDGSVRVLSQLVLSGAVAGERVRGSGGLFIGQEVALEEMSWSGSVQCSGLISAEAIELTLQGASEVGELAGAKIRVMLGKVGNWTRWVPFTGSQAARLMVSEVSGDDILLEGTHAKTVRGDRVVIGAQCRIDRVEYRDSLEVHPDALVGESVKLGS